MQAKLDIPRILAKVGMSVIFNLFATEEVLGFFKFIFHFYLL